MGHAGWVENVVDSSRFDRIDKNHFPVFDSSCQKSICKMQLRANRVETNPHDSFPLLSIGHAGSRFARRDSVRVELRHNVQIESNCKVPQTNRLSLGVLEMDVRITGKKQILFTHSLSLSR